MNDSKYRILIADDEEQNRLLLMNLCEEPGYETYEAKNGQEAIDQTIKYMPDLIIMDVMMPETNGFEATERLKAKEITKHIPIIIATALGSRQDRLRGISKGADDFLLKPCDMEELSLRIRNNIKLKKYHDFLKEHNKILEEQVEQRTKKLKESHEKIKHAYIETIYRLTLAAEYKDGELGAHIRRISIYSKILAEKLGMDSKYVENIYNSSPMHDIGKVGVPDSILLKSDPLTLEEWELMKKHTIIGANILEGSESEFLKMGKEIALTHHEKWDGSGYPHGLKGEDISLSGRIVIIADQYDALGSKRPYKPSFDHEKTVGIITKGDGRTVPKHFDPEVLKMFKKTHKEFEEIFETFKDQ
ncbi:MAG: response regulator [Deltaproteobacteria bacterium]|nr:response regulator [Deltaproteobacteria bacterium]